MRSTIGEARLPTIQNYLSTIGGCNFASQAPYDKGESLSIKSTIFESRQTRSAVIRLMKVLGPVRIGGDIKGD